MALLTIIVCAVFVVIFSVLGQYIGGAVFLKITHLSLHYLSFNTLYNNWRSYGDTVVKPYLIISMMVAVVVTIAPIIIFFIVLLQGEKEEIHGSARWANDRELAKSNLFPSTKKKNQPEKPAILLGKMNAGRFKGEFVRLEGQQFVGVKAPTRTGKGISIVIVNAVAYPDSMVILDIKFENFIKSAGYRQAHGQAVFLFAPAGYVSNEADRETEQLRTHRWNPFDYIRRSATYRVGDIMTITDAFYPTAGRDDPWNALAGKLFKGLVLWMLDSEQIYMKTPTLPYLFALTGVDGGLVKWMKTELTHSYVSNETKVEFNNFLDAPDETRGSILSNLVSPLAMFNDKVCAESVSASDFDFRQLRKKRMTIYVGVNGGDLEKFRPLLNLFFEQLINENTRTLPEHDPSLKYQCLLLLDEFASLGCINKIKSAISFTAGYNLRFLLIFQTLSQLEDNKVYGKEGANNIMNNLAVEVVFPPKEVDASVKTLSETLGTKTVKVKNNSVAHGKNRSRSDNYTLQKRPLLYPHEIKDLGNEMHPLVDVGIKTILIKENQRPFIMDKIIYFNEPVFAKRVSFAQAHIPTIPLLPLAKKRIDNNVE